MKENIIFDIESSNAVLLENIAYLLAVQFSHTGAEVKINGIGVIPTPANITEKAKFPSLPDGMYYVGRVPDEHFLQAAGGLDKAAVITMADQEDTSAFQTVLHRMLVDHAVFDIIHALNLNYSKEAKLQFYTNDPTVDGGKPEDRKSVV